MQISALFDYCKWLDLCSMEYCDIKGILQDRVSKHLCIGQVRMRAFAAEELEGRGPLAPALGSLLLGTAGLAYIWHLTDFFWYFRS